MTTDNHDCSDNEERIDLSLLLDSDGHEIVGQLIRTLHELIAQLSSLKIGLVDNDAFARTLWQLVEDLCLLSGAIRGQLVVRDDQSAGLFRDWSDEIGMRLWQIIAGISSIKEAVAEVAYWYTRALEDTGELPLDEPDDSPEPGAAQF